MQAYIRHPWDEDFAGQGLYVPSAGCVLPGNEFVESVQKYSSAYLRPRPLEKEQQGFARKLGEVALGECFRNICTGCMLQEILREFGAAFCILG